MIRDFIGNGIADAGPNRNVVNILRLLTEDEYSTVYVPYNYIAAKLDRSKDPRVHFPPKESGRPLTVKTMQSNQERFNFSVTCLADVKVEYYPEEGKTELRDKKVWRTYSIIKDGKLHVDTLAARLSKDAYDHLIDCDILMLGDKKIDSSYEYDGSAVYTLNLADVPLISSNWARPQVLGFAKMQLESQRIAEKLKAAKKLLKEAKQDLYIDEAVESDVYTESVQDYGSKQDIQVDAVTYTVVENPGYVVESYDKRGLLNTSEGCKAIKDDIDAMNKELENLRFKCACIKWACESAKTHRRSPFEWSDVYQKKAGTSRYYQDAVVEIDGTNFRLERCTFKKTV